MDINKFSKELKVFLMRKVTGEESVWIATCHQIESFLVESPSGKLSLENFGSLVAIFIADQTPEWNNKSYLVELGDREDFNSFEKRKSQNPSNPTWLFRTVAIQYGHLPNGTFFEEHPLAKSEFEQFWKGYKTKLSEFASANK